MFQGTLSTAGDMIHLSTAPQSSKIRISTTRDQGTSDTKHVCCLASFQLFGSIFYCVCNRDDKRFRRPTFNEKASPPFAQRFGVPAHSLEKVRTDKTNGGLWRPLDGGLWRPLEDAIQKASSRTIREGEDAKVFGKGRREQQHCDGACARGRSC